MRALLLSLVLTSVAFAGGGGFPTTTTLASSANPSVSGQPVTFTATVGSGNGVPGGTVTFTFSGGGPSQMITLSAGQATAVAFLTSGQTVTASYGGLGIYLASTSAPLTQTVNQASTSTTLISSLNPSVFGQTVNFIALVSPVAPSSGLPTGTVTFTMSDGPALTAPVRALVRTKARPDNRGGAPAIASVSTLAGGSHVVTATYNGDAHFTSSTSSPLTQLVHAATTAISLASSANPALAGQQVTLTATVSSAAGLPAGVVRFAVSGGPTLTGALNGNGQATASLRPGAGSLTITAMYDGDPSFNSSTSQSLTQTVNQVPAATTPTSSLNPSLFGQAVTFTATLSSASAVTGTLTFFDGSNSIGTVALNSADTGALTTSSLSIGRHSIAAIYGSTIENTASRPLTQIVRGTPAVSLSASNNAPSATQAITITAAVASPAPGAPVPSGTVTLTDGTTTLGDAMLDASGQVVFTLSGGLSAGTHSLVAQYSGDVYYVAASSVPLLEQIAKGASTTSLGSSIGNNQLSLTAVVTSVAAGTPDGTVQIFDRTSGTSLGSGSLRMRQFSITLSPPFPAGHTLQAVYAGDASFAASTSAPRVLIVAVNSFSGALGSLAADEIVTLFGSGFSDQPGEQTNHGTTSVPHAAKPAATVTLIDAAGQDHAATVLYVSQSQINFVVPEDVPMGAAQISISTSTGANVTLETTIQSGNPVSPGIATFDGTVAAGEFLIVHSDGSQAAPVTTGVFDKASGVWKPVPPVWGVDDQLYLLLNATGFRHSPGQVRCRLGGETVAPDYAGPQPAFPGLDQINLHIPESLRSAGIIHVACTADGLTSNSVTVALE